MTDVTLEVARKAALTLTGEIAQVPPMVSALKVGGRRLHELARAGIEVERAARAVTVSRFEVDLACPAEADAPAGPGPVLAIDVVCSSGTYVRSLAADLGAALGGGAHLRRLRRLAVGSYGLEESVSLGTLERMVDPAGVVLRPLEALRGMARAVVPGDVAAAVGHGKVLPVAALRGWGAEGPGPWAVVSEEGTLLAVYEAHGPQQAKPAVVLASAAADGALS
jgi:tRNA pseudouridine55 synthase